MGNTKLWPFMFHGALVCRMNISVDGSVNKEKLARTSVFVVEVSCSLNKGNSKGPTSEA
jgi:hypothetical protein